VRGWNFDPLAIKFHWFSNPLVSYARRIAMLQYELIETDEGLTVAEILPGFTPEEVASRYGGSLIDPGPYDTYEDAHDALLSLKFAEEEELD
jgi:hypothetical protein